MSWLERDVQVVHRQPEDADEPGGQSRGHREPCPPVPSRAEQGRHREARQQGGKHHSRDGLREVLQWHSGDGA